MGGHIHEHHLGGDAGPIGEMREVQGKHFRRFRRGLGPGGRKAPADSVDRPHLEDVGRSVDESGDRMGGVGGADGDPGVPPVDPVLVIRDRRSAVSRRSLPGQHDLAVPARRRQVPGRSRRGRSRRWWWPWWWRPWWWRAAAALEVGDGCGPRPKRRILRRTQAGVLDPHGREVVQIGDYIFGLTSRQLTCSI